MMRVEARSALFEQHTRQTRLTISQVLQPRIRPFFSPKVQAKLRNNHLLVERIDLLRSVFRYVKDRKLVKFIELLSSPIIRAISLGILANMVISNEESHSNFYRFVERILDTLCRGHASDLRIRAIE